MTGENEGDWLNISHSNPTIILKFSNLEDQILTKSWNLNIIKSKFAAIATILFNTATLRKEVTSLTGGKGRWLVWLVCWRESKIAGGSERRRKRRRTIG